MDTLMGYLGKRNDRDATAAHIVVNIIETFYSSQKKNTVLFKSFSRIFLTSEANELCHNKDTTEKITASKEARMSPTVHIKKNTNMCKHPSQVGFENIYKMYKNMFYCVIVLFHQTLLSWLPTTVSTQSLR